MKNFQLKKYYLTKLSFDYIFPKEKLSEKYTEKLSLNYHLFKHPENDLRRLMDLEVSIACVDGDGDFEGPQIESVIHGDFLISDEQDVSKREMQFRVSAVSVLYSTLRGILGNLSGSYPGDQYCLPTIAPNEVVREIESGRTGEIMKGELQSKKGKSLEKN